jgi:hypothetical protein
MSAIQATGTGTYFQYVQQNQSVNGQSQSIQNNNQDSTNASIVRQAMSGHLKNSENIMSVRQGQSRGNVIDITA